MERKYRILTAFVLVPLFLAGCARSILMPTTLPPLSTTTASTLTPAQADNQLSGDLYNFYQSQSGNVFFSPFSIITAMAMAQEGANGPTAAQMQSILSLSPNASLRQQGFQQLISEINAPGKSYSLSTANNLWIQQGFNVLPSYLNVVQNDYYAGVTNVDFVGNPTAALQTVNGAVSQETMGYIPNLLSPANISSLTRLILTNAIYFKADWQSQFVTTGTGPQAFTLPTGGTETVSMMHQTLPAFIGNFNGAASVLALSYKNNEASMYIFLPPVGGMTALESAISGPSINSWLAANASSMTTSSSSNPQVALSLPRFSFSTSYDLTNTFIQMGMPLPFAAPGQADFSGIDGAKDLHISDVVHKAFVNVGEFGTTAAAATAVVIGTMNSAMGPVILPIPFTVNHPFIFMIVENTTNTVLFMGRVNDPLSTN